jgi:hypothetical protein
VATKKTLDDQAQIIGVIRCRPDTPRHCTIEKETLSKIRGGLDRHIRNTYLKSVRAPVGVEPVLKGWTELNWDGGSAEEQGRTVSGPAARSAEGVHRNQRLGHDAGQPTPGAAAADALVPAAMCLGTFCAPHFHGRSWRDRTGAGSDGGANRAGDQ